MKVIMVLVVDAFFVIGMGYTGHSFNDFNHVDLTAMLDSEADNENEGRISVLIFPKISAM